MKIRRFILAIVALGIWNYSFSQKTEVQKYYIRKDTLFISKLTEAYNTSTEKLFKVLKVNDEDRENLGFGYQLKQSGIGKGSLSVYYSILYLNNEMIAYRMGTYIPNKSNRIKKLYRTKLSELFEIDKDDKVKPLVHGIDHATNPLENIEKPNGSELDEVMSPFSGILYGNRCGHGMEVLNIRKMFDAIISNENCEYLMYSKNPATRLMAIEYYYDHLNEFDPSQQATIDLRIEKLKRNPMLTKVCSGCMAGGQLTQKLITDLKKEKQQ